MLIGHLGTRNGYGAVNATERYGMEPFLSLLLYMYMLTFCIHIFNTPFYLALFAIVCCSMTEQGGDLGCVWLRGHGSAELYRHSLYVSTQNTVQRPLCPKIWTIFYFRSGLKWNEAWLERSSGTPVHLSVLRQSTRGIGVLLHLLYNVAVF